MIVHYDDAPAPPPCFNRPPAPPFYVRHVLNELTGQVEPVEIRMDWAKPGCATWEGTGIGPNGERYPEAMGWRKWCLLCPHMRDEYR